MVLARGREVVPFGGARASA
jgi:hypothetical protein